MRLSVIAPSLRNSHRLGLCIASIADQWGDVDHIVQNAKSDKDILEWLLAFFRHSFIQRREVFFNSIRKFEFLPPHKPEFKS